MTELNHDEPNVMQHGGFTAEYRPFTDLTPGTELILSPGLTDSDTEKLYAQGITAYVTQVEGRDATRVFISDKHAQDVEFSVRDDGSLTPLSARNLLKILSSENEIIEE